MTTFDEHADDAIAVTNTGPKSPEERAAILRRLDEIVTDCTVYHSDDATIYITAAMDYLDRQAVTPGLLQWLLLDSRFSIIGPGPVDGAEREQRIRAEFAALVREVQGNSEPPGPVVLPLTCASPEAHARAARRRKPLWWLREAGLLDGKPADDQPCPVCRLPWPKSHRRNG